MNEKVSQRHFLPAFTLVELVIVFAIIAITSGIILVNLSSQRSEQDLLRASHELAAAIREAQNYALTGKINTAGQRNCAYYVRFDEAPRMSYTVVGRTIDAAGSCTTTGNSYAIDRRSFGGGVAFAPYASGTQGGVGFSLPRGEPVWFDGSSWVAFNAPRLITLRRSSVNYYLCFYPSGRVEERRTDSSCPS